MSEYVDYGPGVTASTRDRTHTLFGQTMGLVAVTTGFFALGAYLGRNMTGGLAILWWIVLVLRGVLPAVFAIAMGLLVAGVQHGEGLGAGPNIITGSSPRSRQRWPSSFAFSGGASSISTGIDLPPACWWLRPQATKR